MQLTIKQMLDGLGKGDFSALELTQCALDNAEQTKKLNIYSYIAEDSARKNASQSDERRKTGKAGKIDGIPLAHKDLFAINGMDTQAASKILSGFKPPYTATVIDRLEQAGSITIGKLNQDEFAMGSANKNSCYGNVVNPWRANGKHAISSDTDLIPGGSSGGSSASVAMRAIPAATGSDTGGSIRQPAALTGTVGIKPTYGRCSRYGMVAFASSLDQASILTRTVWDGALLLEIMCGHDASDMTTSRKAVPNFHESFGQSIKGLKIGVAQEYFPDNLDGEIKQNCLQAQELLQQAGAEIVPISLKMTEYALPAYYVIAPAEASGNLSRYDGVRYGHRTADDVDTLDEMYRKTRAEGFGDEVKRRILIGTYVLSAGYYDAYFLKAQKVRRLILQDFQQAFTQCDVILAPTTPNAAEPIATFGLDPVQAYLSDIFTVPASMAGLPALSLPSGLNQDGLPLGVQFIGQHFDEPRLLQVADIFESEIGFDAQPQGIICRKGLSADGE